MSKCAGRVRVGVVGIGFGQQVHIPAFRLDGRCEVVGICASTRERATQVAARHAVPNACGDWRQIVQDPGIDAIAIATPPCVQAEIAVAAASEGKAVFCEKPMASSLDGARAMLLAADKSGCAHVVDFEFPEIEEWRRAKSILDSGVLGNLRHIQVTWHMETYGWRTGATSWKMRAEDGGGVLNSFVAHSLYYLEWLFGRVRRLEARLLTGNGGGVSGEALAVICLELGSGVPVSLSVSANAFLGSGHRVEVYGDEGSLVLENPTSDYVAGFRLFLGSRKDPRLLLVPSEPERRASGADGRIAPVGRLVARFIDWVQSGIPTEPNFKDGLRVQALLDAARAAHGRGQWGVMV